jgi:hypothetical protein
MQSVPITTDVCMYLDPGEVYNIMRAEGIHIYAVGIGLKDTRELDGMASVPASENSFNVQSFDELAALSDTVFQSFCPGNKYSQTCSLDHLY